MAKTLLALYDNPDTASEALSSLGHRAVEGVRVVSPAAYPVVHQTGKPGPWRLMGFLAFAGGMLGLTTAIVLEAGSAAAHPVLHVGGKPDVAWPAFGVVMFELTMLGAGLTNFVSLIVLSWLSRRKIHRKAREAVTADRVAVVVPVGGKSDNDIAAIRSDLAGAFRVEVMP